MFFSSIKDINRLIGKEMSNIYLNVTIKKNWRSRNFDFLSLKNLSPGELELAKEKRIYIVLPIIKHYFIQFFACF